MGHRKSSNFSVLKSFGFIMKLNVLFFNDSLFRKDCFKRLEMLRTNKSIVIDALTQLVEQHDGSSTKHDAEDSDESIEQLEKDVTRVLKEKNAVLKKKKINSRTSSLDSSCPPGSPFQNNPQLMSHDYAKSPLMEDISEEIDNEEDDTEETDKKEEIIEIDLEAEENDPVRKFDPRTKQLFEPHQFAPKDLLTLLKTIESDIHACFNVLRDESEKRKKHRIDDCRRVHDYDEFITTFLAMLAEQGHLGDLLEHSLNFSNVSHKKKSLNSSNGGSNGSSSSNGKNKKNKTLNKSKNNKSNRGRPKKKK